jgi:membrane associated rhomboid family serine protease
VKGSVAVLIAFLAAVWGVSLACLALGVDAVPILVPRTTAGLAGVVTMPFVHGSLAHLVVNTGPLAVFAWLVLIGGTKYFFRVTAVVVIVGGLGVWALGRGGAHVGASGLVFGYFGFLVARGLYDQKLRSIFIAGLVAVLYGGMIWGVLPTLPGVSWEAHLAGLVAGVFAARSLRH